MFCHSQKEYWGKGGGGSEKLCKKPSTKKRMFDLDHRM